MGNSTLAQTIYHFQKAFEDLDIQMQDTDIEELSLLVYNQLSSAKRQFHNTKHVLKVCEPLKNPLEVIAALFHDIIYYQVDSKIPSQHLENIKSLVDLENTHEPKIREDFPNDKWFSFCLDIFNYETGKIISISGMNELLSAYIASLVLSPFLNDIQTITVIVAIECTIPFRVSNGNGLTHFEGLEIIIKKACENHDIEITEEEIIKVIKSGINLANSDVENFGDRDTKIFLDNTWALISESNQHISSVKSYAYSIRSYREALMRMEKFLNFLNPASVFHTYQGVPERKFYNKINRYAHKNIDIARQYLGAKLLSMAIVEAIAIETGGDAPMALFMGEARDEENYIPRAEDFLPTLNLSNETTINPIVLKVLQDTRSSELNFDMKHSPLSAHIYKILGMEKTQEYLEYAKEMFDEKITAKEFLEKIDRQIVSDFCQAFYSIAITRQKALQELF